MLSGRRLLWIVAEDWFFRLHYLPLARAQRAAGAEVHLAARCGRRGAEAEAAIVSAGVTVHRLARLDRTGQAVLIAFPLEWDGLMADDKVLREMTSDPKFRKVLVTDGKTAVGQAIVHTAQHKHSADVTRTYLYEAGRLGQLLRSR